MKPLAPILAAAALTAAAIAQTNPPIGQLSFTNLPFQLDFVTAHTNRFTNVVSVVSVTPVDTPCPECGGLNHHERHVEIVEIYEIVTATMRMGGQTNSFPVYRSPGYRLIRTNIVPKSIFPLAVPPRLGAGQR